MAWGMRSLKVAVYQALTKNLFSWLDTASECFGACSDGILTRGGRAAFTTHHSWEHTTGHSILQLRISLN